MKAKSPHNPASWSLPTPPDNARVVEPNIVLTYEQRLNSNSRWALSEGSRHFEKDSEVFKSLFNVTQRLNDLGIPYAVVGGMALFKHGVRRFTEDVDILVTKKSLKIIHEKLDGLGYLPPFPNSKNLRDVQNGVKIEFLIAGDYPGDGRAKPVSFPDPQDVSVEGDGIFYINLPKFIELKLASGMTNESRLKDLADVIELIKVLDLPVDYSNQLDEYVREKYRELWKRARKRFVALWRNKWLTSEAKTIQEMVEMLRAAAAELDEMRKAGVFLEDSGGASDDYARLVTTDPSVAEKFGLVDENEFWGDDDDEETITDDSRSK